MSKSNEALVGAAGMKDRKRGLSQETTAVDELVDEELEHVRSVVALGAHQPGQLLVERLDQAAEVERDRVQGQPLPARRDDQVGHRLVVVEHRVRHQAGEGSGPGARWCAARHASSARLDTSCNVAPVFAATRATSSNSGLARPLVTFIRMVMPSSDLGRHLAGHRPSFDGMARMPIVPVDPRDLAPEHLDLRGLGQDVQHVSRPALLHRDRAHPRVECTGFECGRDGVPQLLTRHVIEIRLEHERRLS